MASFGIKVSVGPREKSVIGVFVFCWESAQLCAISPSAEITALLFSSLVMLAVEIFTFVYVALKVLMGILTWFKSTGLFPFKSLNSLSIFTQCPL